MAEGGCSEAPGDHVPGAPIVPGPQLPATGGDLFGRVVVAGMLAAAAAGAEVTRRRFLGLGLAAGAVLATSGLRARPVLAAEGEARPNILWFRSEDNSADLIGAYGNDLARTPTIDRLAAEGVLYERFFATSPVCAPTKLGWTTGMYEAGMGPGHHMRAVGNRPAFAVGFATWLAAAGYWCTTSGNTDYNSDFGGTHGFQDSVGNWQAGVAAGQPFFALLGTATSHELTSVSPVPTGTNPLAVDLPAYHPDDPILRLDRAAYMDRVAAMDGELAGVLTELDRLGVADDTIVVYSSDHGGVLPRSKRFCYDSGLHAPLIIRFPERWQHLAPGPPGSRFASPVSSVDAAPTVLQLAGLPVPDHFEGQSFAGAVSAPRELVFGNRNRMDEAIDFVRTVRDVRYRYLRNYMPHLPWGQHIQFMWLQAGVRQWETLHLAGLLDDVRDRFWREKPAEELYDLEADPDEVHNLIDAPAHQAPLQRLREALDAHMLRINDNGFLPEGHAAEGWDRSRRPGAYPLPRLLELGALAIRRDPANLPTIGAALEDANDVVRYWGALGHSMLGPAAASAAELLTSHMDDTDETAWVRAQCADALCRAGSTAGAVPYLGSVAGDEGAPFSARLQAIASLAHLGLGGAAALVDLTLASTSSNSYVSSAALYAVRRVSGTYVPAP